MLSTLPKARLDAFDLKGDELREHLKILRSIANLPQKLAEVFELPQFESPTDPDLMIYTGGFFSDADKHRRTQITQATPETLAQTEYQFEDPRLNDMLLRYKARNFPNILTEEEAEQWEIFRKQRLTDIKLSGMTIKLFFETLQSLSADPNLTEQERFILEELQLYGESILPYE